MRERRGRGASKQVLMCTGLSRATTAYVACCRATVCDTEYKYMYCNAYGCTGRPRSFRSDIFTRPRQWIRTADVSARRGPVRGDTVTDRSVTNLEFVTNFVAGLVLTSTRHTADRAETSPKSGCHIRARFPIVTRV